MARSARSKGLKDKRYLAFIASDPCIVCILQQGFRAIWNNGLPGYPVTEVAHIGPRGLSQKCSDRETIPLCAHHHRLGPESHHVLGKKFWDHHGLDRDALIAEYNRRYEEEHGVQKPEATLS